MLLLIWLGLKINFKQSQSTIQILNKKSNTLKILTWNKTQWKRIQFTRITIAEWYNTIRYLFTKCITFYSKIIENVQNIIGQKYSLVVIWLLD